MDGENLLLNFNVIESNVKNCGKDDFPFIIYWPDELSFYHGT